MRTNHFHADSGFEPMTVNNAGFLVDRLGQDCHPLQFLRELTQNAIEAVVRTGGPGEIIWDAEECPIAGESVLKLSITDNGEGMTGSQLVQFINQLSSSGSPQHVNGNYGVGAKIAAATQHPCGVVYESWRNGEGSKIHLYRNEATGQYGLKQWHLGDDCYDYFVPLSESSKPQIIQQHGTKVVLWGHAEGDNTTQPPKGTKSPSRWIAKNLNSRYFKFPNGVNVRVREGWDYPGDKDRHVLRTLTGMESYLYDHAQASGSTKLVGAKARWWILKDEPAISSNSGHIESSGHMAALYQGELYELQTGVSGINRLQQFGVLFGHRQVVIYIEPSTDRRRAITTNTARTHLVYGGESLPWANWAREFIQKMPRQLHRFIQDKGAAAINADPEQNIRKRLQKIMHLFNLSHYRPTRSGADQVAESSVVENGKAAPCNGEATRVKESSSSSDAGNKGPQKPHSKAEGAKTGRKTKTDLFPKVVWISSQDGTRETGQLEDRAARYLAGQNLLQINRDFSAFVDMIGHCCSDFSESPNIRKLAETAVRACYEQTLVEAVIGVQALQQRKEWAPSDLEKVISPEALTAAVMPKYHIHQDAKRKIIRLLGPRRLQRSRSKIGKDGPKNAGNQFDTQESGPTWPPVGDVIGHFHMQV